MADVKNKTASIYIDDTAAQQALVDLQKKADSYNKTIDDLRKKQKALNDEIEKTKAAGDSYTKQTSQLKSLNSELSKSEKALQANVDKQKALQQQIDSKVGPSLKQQQQLLSKLVNEYKNLGNNSSEAAAKLKQIEEASKSLNVMKDRLDAVTKVQKEGGNTFEHIFGRVAEYFTAYALIEKATDITKEFFQTAIEEALHEQQSLARLKTALDNVGRSDAFDRLSKGAEETAKQFKYLDSADVNSVFEKLITYGKITEDQMQQLLPVIINFAAKQRISLEDATDSITKSLEGNSRALKQYGIDLSDASTPAERLKVIMTELKERVDGAGAAFQETAEGKIAVAKQQYKDLAKELGDELLPALTGILDFTVKAVKGLELMAQKIKNTFSDVKEFFKNGIPGVKNNQEKRDFKAQLETEQAVADKFIEQFREKSAEEVRQQIIELQNTLEFKTKLVNALPRLIKEGVADNQDFQNAATAVRLLRKELDGLFQLQDEKTNNATFVAPKTPTAGGEDALKKQEDLQKKLLEAQKRFLEQQHTLNVDYGIINESELDKETTLAIEKFNKQKDAAKEIYDLEIQLAGNNKDKIAAAKQEQAARVLQIEKDLGDAVLQIQTKYAQKELDNALKLDEEKRKLREKELQEELKKGFAEVQRIGEELTKNADRANQLRRAQLNYDISKASGKKKLDLEMQQLDQEEQLAIAAAIKRGDSVDAVEIEFQQKREELTKDRFAKEAELYLGFVQQVVSILSTINDAQTSKENARLAKIQSQNELEKASYQRMLNNKLISTQAYNKKVSDLDAQLDKKKQEIEKQQFERNKKMQIAQALVNGALGITSVLAARPGATDIISLGLFRAINIALTVASTAAQVAAIAKTQYQGSTTAKYGKGGHLNGPSHNDGGMPVINPRTGKKEAEVEGGEVILSRKTVANNRSLVGALLDSSMNRNGARIDPWFKTRTFKEIDFSGISRSIQNVKVYESGGTFQVNKSDAAQNNANPIIVPAMTEQQESLMQALLFRLQQPWKSYVVYQDLQDAESTIDSIKGDVTFGKK